jgi:hypothetical protein
MEISKYELKRDLNNYYNLTSDTIYVGQTLKITH